MERLTKRDESTGSAYFPRCFDTCGGIGCVNAKCNEKLMAEVCQRLADYEDAEERGETEVGSHSERHIVEGCISLMQDVVEQVKNYLDWRGINYPTDENEEEYFVLRYSYSEIINILLLWHTFHSGGTSTAQKCRELGFDYGEAVRFEFDRDGEDE